MSQVLRQSTQIIVRLGPAVAVGDGFTPVTSLDLSTADEAELLKANTTTTTSIAAATFAAITGCDGWYGLTLTTSLTDTVGCLDVMINDDSLILPIFARFQVIEEAAFDALYAASADPKADINVATIDANAITATAIADGAIDAATFAAGAINAAAIADGAIDAATFAANAITSTVLANDAITAAKVAADVSAEIADAVWDEDATGHQTQGSFGQAIGDPAADTNTIYKAVVTDAAGATVGLDVVAVKADTAAILVDTGTTLDAKIDAIDNNVDAILVDTAEIGAAGAGLTNINLPNQTMDIVGNITGNLSGSVGSVTGAVGSVTGAVGSVTGNVSGNVTGTIGGLTAAALKDFFDTDSGDTYAGAVAGSVVKEIADNAGGASLTVQDIVDGVWDEPGASHADAGSFGEFLNQLDAPVAEAVWSAATADFTTAGSFGKQATDTKADTAAILVDTAEIGVAGAGLTNIDLPNQTMNITGNITGNLSGSVGSVTGAVGSVTGNVGGNVAGSVASVTADVNADIKKVNGVTLTGTGVLGDEWEP